MKKCIICGNEFDMFLPFGGFGAAPRPNAQCPNCGSLERHRVLWYYISGQNLIGSISKGKNKVELLHIAPEPVFYDKFSADARINYHPADINPGQPFNCEKVDITDIPYEDCKFDLILCNHVLEHVIDEKKALSELKRVLSRRGIAFINAPVYNQEMTLENPQYNTPELRLKYYGQEDHVRKYGRDYGDRLRTAGFEADELTPVSCLTPDECSTLGVNKLYKIYRCTR